MLSTQTYNDGCSLDSLRSFEESINKGHFAYYVDRDIDQSIILYMPVFQKHMFDPSSFSNNHLSIYYVIRNLSNCLFLCGDDRALEVWKSAVELVDGDPRGWEIGGDIMHGIFGDNVLAVEYYSKAIAMLDRRDNLIPFMELNFISDESVLKAITTQDVSKLEDLLHKRRQLLNSSPIYWDKRYFTDRKGLARSTIKWFCGDDGYGSCGTCCSSG